MRVMTFNIQHCKNYVSKQIDPDVMARAIVELDADVVGLNEVYGHSSDPDYDAQEKRLASLANYGYSSFAGAIVTSHGSYGNALISRIPIVSSEVIAIPDPVTKCGKSLYETRCLLRVRLENGVTVLVTHFGLNPDEQRNAVDTVLASLADTRCVLMGDFNVRPDNGALVPIRERMYDAAEAISGEALSFPSDLPDRKIDYIFVSRDLGVTYADIPAVVASDHRPHVADLRFNRQR